MLAADLATDPDRLAMLRSGMRDRLAASPLLDGDGFARAVETAFAEVCPLQANEPVGSSRVFT